ncbi:MAG: DUF2500 domain-containing protein [Clostridia bacterium]|nr:DUF2500 domain-containing protein [Clostridia bacterium]
MSSIFLLLFGAVFLLSLIVFTVVLVKMAQQRRVNNNSPRLTVEARVVSRRRDVSHHNSPNAGDITGAHGYTTTSSTTYYATFQVESGDRLELAIPGSQYGYLAEGDTGRLTFQGTRFLSFERN